MIGIFDSGIGGLSILQTLRAELPTADFIYVADSGHAPYGERDSAHVMERARTITKYLYEQHIEVLVIACNTATAAAGKVLRAEYPQLPNQGPTRSFAKSRQTVARVDQRSVCAIAVSEGSM